MPAPEETINLYFNLAEEHERTGQVQERDRFLVLAADAAFTAGREEQAEQLRRTLLARNPHHLLKPYASYAEAIGSRDILVYVQQLRRSFPYEKAEHLLVSLRGGGTSLKPVVPPDEEFDLPMDADAGGSDRPRSTLGPVPKPPSPTPRRETVAPFSVEPPSKSSAKPQPARGPQPFGVTPSAKPTAKAGNPLGFLTQESRALVRRPAPEPEAPPAGGWVGAFLFVVVLCAGLALFGYTFVWPFVKDI